ncbi:MAG: hypothetical protein ACYDBJ_20610 [Aggregatilineales bacterium]
MPELKRIYDWMGVNLPIFITVSVTDVNGYIMFINGNLPRFQIEHIDRNELLIPEILIDSFDVNFGDLMKPIFDAMWNAAGFDGSPSYDAHGKRISR